MNCKDHPMAPHGFLRQASHDAGRYVCECEYWNEDDYNLSISNILEGEKITVDDSIGYELSTHEKQQEFAKNRNYHYTNTDNPIDFPKNCPWDEWKATKDIA